MTALRPTSIIARIDRLVRVFDVAKGHLIRLVTFMGSDKDDGGDKGDVQERRLHCVERSAEVDVDERYSNISGVFEHHRVDWGVIRVSHISASRMCPCDSLRIGATS